MLFSLDKPSYICLLLKSKIVCPQCYVSFFPVVFEHGIKYQYVFYIQSRKFQYGDKNSTHRCQASVLVVGNGCTFSAILVRL